jgi:hypothetical protein
MGNKPAASKQDAELAAAEGELCTTLLIASSACDRSLTQDEVDQLLGVRHPVHV